MKIRGLVLLIAAVAAFAWFAHDSKVIRESSSFGYEYGSAGAPVPLHKELIALFGLFGTLVGFALVTYDFANWIRRKKT